MAAATWITRGTTTLCGQLSRAYRLLTSLPEGCTTKLIESGDFRVDLGARRTTVCGRELDLTEEEFDVLIYLISHGKRLITPRTMLATRSGDGGVRQAKVLPVLLSLRKRLREELPGDQHLRTEAWVLYEFHPEIEPSSRNSCATAGASPTLTKSLRTP